MPTRGMSESDALFFRDAMVFFAVPFGVVVLLFALVVTIAVRYLPLGV
jgi:hypothetical protein